MDTQFNKDIILDKDYIVKAGIFRILYYKLKKIKRW